MPFQEALVEWLAGQPDFLRHSQEIAGGPVLRVWVRRKPPAAPQHRSLAKRFAADLLPPVVTRSVRRILR